MTKHLTPLAMAVFKSIGETMAQRGTTAWLFVALVVALALAIGGWRLGSVVVPVALDAEARLTDFRQLSTGQLVAHRSPALDDLYQSVSEAESDIRPASRTTRWVSRFSPAFSWLPVARQEMDTWASQVHRVQQDLHAASALLDSSSRLLDLHNDAQSALLTPGSSPSLPFLKAQALELETSFADSLQAVQEARRAGRTTSLGLQAPRVRELTGLLGELEDRALTASNIGRQVSGLMTGLLALAEDAQPLLGQFLFEGSQPDQWSIHDLKATLASMEERALSAARESEEVGALAADTGYAEQLLPQLTTLDQVLAVLLTVSRAGMTGISAVEPAVELMESSSVGLLDRSRGLIDILDAFNERSDEIAQAIAQLEKARGILRDLESQTHGVSFTSGLSQVSSLVSDLDTGLRLVRNIAPMGRSLLGDDGAKKYLVLGQSADELRATGGFVSSIWLVSFENGSLAGVKYDDSVRVDDWERLALYPKAPLGLDEHMNAWVWLLRDVSWDPDFPTTARTAEDMFRIGQRQDVDGVVAISQWTLLRMLEALGSIPSPNGEVPITSRNLLAVLEQGTDQHGRAYMDLVLQGVLDKLDQPMSMPTLIRLASALHGTLQEKDMLLYFNDPDLQSLASEFGWDGSIRQDSADYLYVVDSNVGWSKVDRNIERDISYVIDLTRSPRPRTSLTLSYDNHSGPNSPQCEPQWRFRGIDYSQLKNACYWNFLRVYMPQGSRLLSTPYLALPQESVSVEIGRGVPGEDTGGISSSHDRLLFSGLAELEAGDRSEINLVYDLPASVVRRDGDTLTYQLLIQKQPGVRQREVFLDFIIQDDYRLASSSLPPLNNDDSRVSFALALTEDTLLSFEFKENASDSE